MNRGLKRCSFIKLHGALLLVGLSGKWNSNARPRNTGSNSLFFQNFTSFIIVLHVLDEHEQISTNTHMPYMIGISIRSGLWICTRFCPEIHLQTDPIENDFGIQSLNHDILMNNGWNYAIQPPVYSMFDALPKPHVDFKNQRTRDLTFLMMQLWNRAFQVLICENRSCILLREVIGEDRLAQKCMRKEKYQNAIDASRLQQLQSSTIFQQLPRTIPLNPLQMVIHKRNSRKIEESLMIEWKKCEEKMWKLRELVRFCFLDLRIVISVLWFCYN